MCSPKVTVTSHLPPRLGRHAVFTEDGESVCVRQGAMGCVASLLGNNEANEAEEALRSAAEAVSYTHLTLPTNREV